LHTQFLPSLLSFLLCHPHNNPHPSRHLSWLASRAICIEACAIKWHRSELVECIKINHRSRWPRGIRHELSSLARMPGLWVQIPLKVWMSVCTFILCLLSCV
jgi:hypothetical protein